MRRLQSVGVMAVLVTLAACSSGGESSSPQGSSAATAPPASPSSGSPTGNEVDAEQLRDGPSVEVEPYFRSDFGNGFVDDQYDDSVYIQSPTGNIICQWGGESFGGQILCQLRERSEPLPPPDPECELDWLDTIVILHPRGLYDGTCTGGVLSPFRATTLEYGDLLRFADHACLSETTGITCMELATGRAMTVSKEEVSTFLL